MNRDRKKRGPKQRDGYPREGNNLKDIGELNLVAALLWLPRLGCLDEHMLGILMWPTSAAISRLVLARRMLARLQAKGFCIPVLGGSGARFYVLTSKGAAEIRRLQPAIYATLRSGERLTSVAGTHWQHRWLGNTYLATKVAENRIVATEYEQLTTAPHWNATWDLIPFRGKRCDGLYRARMADSDHTRTENPSGLTVVEVLRTRIRCKRAPNEKHDPMFSLLQSLQQHTTSGIAVDLVVVDDPQGHGILKAVGTEARKRGIWFDPRLVSVVFAPIPPQFRGIPQFRAERWSNTSLPQPTARPVMDIHAGSNMSASGAADIDVGSPAKRGTGLRPPDELVEFKITKDRTNEEYQHREVEIRYLPTDLALVGYSGNRGDRERIEFDANDEDGNPMFLKSTVIVPSDIQLTDPAVRRTLFAKLRAMLDEAGLRVP